MAQSNLFSETALPGSILGKLIDHEQLNQLNMELPKYLDLIKRWNKSRI